jgi:putative transposase
MGRSDAQRLKSLEDENRRLQKLLAESMLDVAALNDLLAKNWARLRRGVGRRCVWWRRTLSPRSRKRATGTRAPITIPQAADQRRSLDFAADVLSWGRRVRVLAIGGDFTREALALVVDSSIGGQRVARELDALTARRGRPAMIVSDNGTELTSRAVLESTNRTGTLGPYIAPGKPTENACVESFIGRFRDECLNEEVFASLAEAPCRDRALAARLQSCTTAVGPRRPHARGRAPPVRGRPAAQPRPAPPGARYRTDTISYRTLATVMTSVPSARRTT